MAAALAVLLALWLARGRDGAAEREASEASEAAGQGPSRAGEAGAERPVRTPDERGGPLRLEGVVLDQAGAPVGGARVVLSTEPPRDTRSEQDGSFFFEGLVPRTFTLHALAGDLVGTVVHRLRSDSEPVVVRVRRGTSVQVRVRDIGGRPIAGAEVRPADLLLAHDGVLTDAAGEALLRGIDNRGASIRATAAGYAPGMAMVLPEVSPSGVAAVELILRRGVAVSGTVRDEAGRPIAGAMIDCSSMSVADQVTSDAEGRFRFPALSPGAYLVTAEGPRHAGGNPKVIEVAELEVTGVELTLPTGGILAGVVVQRAGEPAPYALVRATASTRGEFRSPPRWVTADATGRFELGGLPRQALQLRASDERASSELVEVSLVEVARRDELRVVLDITGSIRGVVVDERGEPVPEVQVRAEGRQRPRSAGELFLGRTWRATTDSSGAFAFHGVPDEDHVLSLGDSSASDELSATRYVRPGATGIKLVLRQTGAVVGRLVDGAGKPVPGPVYVMLSDRGPAISSAAAFRLTDVAPGSYQLQLRAPGLGERTLPQVKVAAGETLELGDVAIDAGRRIVGRVVDLQGRPVVGAKVRASSHTSFGGPDELEGESPFARAMGVLTATSDARGGFELAGVSIEMPMSLSARSPTGSSSTVSVAAGAAPPPVTLVLRGHGSLEGVVTKRGKPVPQVNVLVVPGDRSGTGRFQNGPSGPDGRFLFLQVPEGEIEVSATRGMMAAAPQSIRVTVEAGKRARVTLELEGGELSLSVAVKPQRGHRIDLAEVALFAGEVSVATAQELFVRSRSSAPSRFSLARPSDPTMFHDLDAGRYTLCAAPITSESIDPRERSRAFQHRDKRPAWCQAVTLMAAPAEQRMTIELPSMPPLPPAPAEPMEQAGSGALAPR